MKERLNSHVQLMLASRRIIELLDSVELQLEWIREWADRLSTNTLDNRGGNTDA